VRNRALAPRKRHRLKQVVPHNPLLFGLVVPEPTAAPEQVVVRKHLAAVVGMEVGPHPLPQTVRQPEEALERVELPTGKLAVAETRWAAGPAEVRAVAARQRPGRVAELGLRRTLGHFNPDARRAR